MEMLAAAIRERREARRFSREGTMHAVLRRYENASTLIDVMDRRSQEVERVISSVPGFVAYHAVRSGNTLFTLSVCRDRSGTDETTRRAAQWLRENVPTGAPSAPEISEGEVFIGFGAPQAGIGHAATAATAPNASEARPAL
jgi:hypothetical protein